MHKVDHNENVERRRWRAQCKKQCRRPPSLFAHSTARLIARPAKQIYHMLIDHNLRPRPPWSPLAPLLAANGRRRGAASLPREHVATTHMLCSRFAAITSDLVYVCRDCGAREPCRDQERTDGRWGGRRERHVSANSISFLAQDTARGDPKSPDDDHADADLEPRMEPNHALGQRWGGKGECTGVSKPSSLSGPRRCRYVFGQHSAIFYDLVRIRCPHLVREE